MLQFNFIKAVQFFWILKKKAKRLWKPQGSEAPPVFGPLNIAEQLRLHLCYNSPGSRHTSLFSLRWYPAVWTSYGKEENKQDFCALAKKYSHIPRCETSNCNHLYWFAMIYKFAKQLNQIFFCRIFSPSLIKHQMKEGSTAVWRWEDLLI